MLVLVWELLKFMRRSRLYALPYVKLGGSLGSCTTVVLVWEFLFCSRRSRLNALVSVWEFLKLVGIPICFRRFRLNVQVFGVGIPKVSRRFKLIYTYYSSSFSEGVPKGRDLYTTPETVVFLTCEIWSSRDL